MRIWMACVLSAAGVLAQQSPPATEIYVSPLSTIGGRPTVGPWTNISNNPGYDNQPSFLPDSTDLLFSSNRDSQQTDIYRYDISTKALTQVTRTTESEYSPTVTPDRRTFSVIRVETDNTQRLWRFDLDGANPRLVLENIKPVGYHAWIDSTHLALFILDANGAPATLQIADTAAGTADIVETNIGRSILIRPGRGTVSFVAPAQAPRFVKEFDPRSRAVTTLAPAVDGGQDCAWLPDGRLLMARGQTISIWTPGQTEWSALATIDAASPGAPAGLSTIDQIARLAVSPDGKWLTFVAEPHAR